jgi:DNA-binding NtrC family response regulator/pSer/pThr/pTyr-binding forkhead associated (FHA) protein
MSLPRLVVIDGPDVGAEFPIPKSGGGVGRGEGNLVQLSDLAVSRNHCELRVEGQKVVLVDASSRNRTVVNGQPVTEHPLAEGDEISIGKTRLAFLPADVAAVVPTGHVARVTLEISTEELLKVRGTSRGAAQDGRAHRHLAALARLGDQLRRATDRSMLGRVACETVREALEAERVILLLPDVTGRLSPVAGAGKGAEDATAFAVAKDLPKDVVDRCVKGRHALLLTPPGPRPLVGLAAPMAPGEDAQQAGLLYAERAPPAGGPVNTMSSQEAWGETDLQLAVCVAQLASAALEGLLSRELLARENRALEERLGGSRDFIGEGGAARALLGFIAKVAPTDSTLLLLGESGSGKEMVAAAVHYASRRSRGPFVCLNCAALSETLLESELFGHEKGAFTGATERKLGRFELADQGTLFFDEVGELSMRHQTMLLRVLEERRFERVGGTRPITVDVRIVAATNRPLADMVRKGEFREDLFYRLSVIQTDVPPLRARREDIPALADHFLAKVRGQTGRRVRGFAPDAMRALMAHSWPGNVRELRNAIERAVVLGEGELVRAEDLPPQVLHAVGPTGTPPTAPSAFVSAAIPVAGTPLPAANSLRELERQGILAALAATGGNKAQAAALLEIDRSTLYKKMKEYKIGGV